MNLNINKKYFWYFVILVALVYAFLIGIFIYDRDADSRLEQPMQSFREWKIYGVVHTYTKTIVKGNIEAEPGFDNVLAFYSSHQNVEVYNYNKLIYKYPTENNNPISSTPGYFWNFVQLPRELNSIQVVFTSPYKDANSKIPKFYVGNIASVTSHIINISLFQFILCIIMFCLGLCMAAYYFVLHRKNSSVNPNMLYLGIFAMFLSVWSINECPITTLIFKNNIVTSYISFLSLMLLPMPFAIFVKNFYNDTSKNWDIFFRLNIAQIIICIALQLIKVYDLRQTLWTTHVIMAVLIVIGAIVFGIIMSIIKDKKKGKSSCGCNCGCCPNSSLCHGKGQKSQK